MTDKKLPEKLKIAKQQDLIDEELEALLKGEVGNPAFFEDDAEYAEWKQDQIVGKINEIISYLESKEIKEL